MATCQHKIPTKVFGRISRTTETSVVGMIFSEFHLDSAAFELVTIELDDEFVGVDRPHAKNVNVFTYARSMCNEVDNDIVSPIVLVGSRFNNFPIYTLVSGTINAVQARSKRPGHSDGTTSLLIVTPSIKGPDLITEWELKLPKMRLDRKVVYIKKFNMYITGCSKEHLEEIRDANSIAAHQIDEASPIVDLHFRCNSPLIKNMYYSFNGILGKVNVEQCLDSVATATLRVGGQSLTLTISNKDLIDLPETIYKVWQDQCGIELLLDTDQDRLSRTLEDIRNTERPMSPDVMKTVNNLRGEVEKLNIKLSDREQMIRDMKAKLTQTEYDLKMEQEEHKTERERIKLESTVSSNDNQQIVEALKIGGAVLGVVAIAITLGTKYQAAQAAAATGGKLVEWAIPLLFEI